MSAKISCSGDSETLAKTVLCRCVAVLVTMCALSSLVSPQSAPDHTATDKGGSSPILFLHLSYPVYPSLARVNNIVGDVVLKVSFRPEGSVESLAAVSGDPVLTQAALDSAKQSLLQCRGCSSSDLSQSLTYSFRIFPAKADPCCCTSRPGVPATPPTTQVSQLENHITIIEPPVCVCPDACSEAWAKAHSRYRSAKCLYLWKCSKRRIWLQ
jgi:Gram-negative bacterial TonB protein C-terminal